MTLELYLHPLASYCWKVLIALYESGTPFDGRTVDLMDPEQRAAFLRFAPLGKFPVIRDAGQTVAESTIIIEYLEHHHPGAAPLIPRDPDEALRTRSWDRYFDQYVHEPMQKIVLDRLRPAPQRDAYGVEQARARLAEAYELLEVELRDRPWAAGPTFTMADCAAAPALYYADRVVPLGAGHPVTSAYLERLRVRPSFARVLVEAEPHFSSFPG
jgi:glutathione S-transferase